jgi:hypothetical protein
MGQMLKADGKDFDDNSFDFNNGDEEMIPQTRRKRYCFIINHNNRTFS